MRRRLPARAVKEIRGHFAELRELCDIAGDKVSLAIGMTGLATELMFTRRPRRGARLVSEQMELLESIGDPGDHGLTLMLATGSVSVGEFGKILRGSQNVIDLAGGDSLQRRRLRHRITTGDRARLSRHLTMVAGPPRVATRPTRRRGVARHGIERGDSRARSRLDVQVGVIWMLRADDATLT